MATTQDFITLALSLAGVSEVPHFERRAFRTKRKIFATLLEKDGIGVALLTPEDQYVYCKLDYKNIFPVPNKWGLEGATQLQLIGIKKAVLKEILRTAYQASL